jgi:thioesterase domain-containing protein
MVGYAGSLDQLDPDQQLILLIEKARSQGLIPSEIDFSSAKRLLAVYAANVEAASCYKPLPIPVRPTLFKASDRLDDSSCDPTLGWAAYCPEGVQVHSVPGNHFSIVREPGVKFLAEKLRFRLATPGI